ncbi:hypothetical protein B0H13DRAFT_2331217 [Mycena leptocephala]|nr:hypothetical protein B0H13DRAFT_2331217 [Mycena leptocephala]
MKISFSLNLRALLGAFFIAGISSATAIPTSHDNSVCEPRTHVVIDSSTVEIYNSSRHGTEGHLRLFKMIPLACPERYIRTLPRELSFRTDLQLRDTRTELSTIVFRRGFFTWAKSLLKFVPSAFSTIVGIFGLVDCAWEWKKNGATVPGGLACVLGAITTAYGIGEFLQLRAAASLATAATNAHELQTIVDRTFSEAGTQYTFGRRANPRFEAAVTKYHSLIQNLTLPGVRHHASGKDVTFWDVARANSTHPITVLHSNRAFKANHSHAVNVWSSVGNPGSGIPRFHFMVPFPYGSNTTSTTTSSELRRQAPPPACPGAENHDLGQGSEQICHPNGIPPPNPNAPGAMYYGFDLYGTKAQVDEFQDDLGSTFDDQNGFVPSIEAMANGIVTANAWDTCVCQMTQNTWISTGSIQMSWDNTYNGYSQCFKPNCDNDAMI